jgi:hypothetical protein
VPVLPWLHLGRFVVICLRQIEWTILGGFAGEFKLREHCRAMATALVMPYSCGFANTGEHNEKRITVPGGDGFRSAGWM